MYRHFPSTLTVTLTAAAMFAVAELHSAEQPVGRTPPGSQSAATVPEVSVTVFPVGIKPDQGPGPESAKRIAAVMALWLEKAGVEDLELAETKFDSPETNDVAQVAAAFAKAVREKPIKTEYAVYGEILGTPKTGPREIRTIVVDKQGKVLLAARDDPRTYTRTGDMVPKCPMTCTLFMAKKLQKLWGLAEPLRKDAPSGKMAEYWRKDAGLPPQKELAAMKERSQVMLKSVKTSKFAVYPIRIGSSTDKQCAAQLADMLNRENICQAVVSDVDPQLQIQGHPNEQKVLWDTARAFRKFVRKHPVAADYAVYADYGIGRSPAGDVNVGHVHVIVCDRAGDWVTLDYQNSHHEDFQAIRPKCKEDCNRLVLRRAEQLVPQPKDTSP